MNPFAAFAEQYFILIERLNLPSPTPIDLTILHRLKNLLNQPEANHLLITQVLSNVLAIPWLNSDAIEASKIPLNMISEPLLRKYSIFPYGSTKSNFI